MRFKLICLLLVSASVAFGEGRFLVADSFIDPSSSGGINLGVKTPALSLKTDTITKDDDTTRLNTAISEDNKASNLDTKIPSKDSKEDETSPSEARQVPLIQSLPVDDNSLQDSKLNTPDEESEVPLTKNLTDKTPTTSQVTSSSDDKPLKSSPKKDASKAKQDESLKIPSKRAERRALKEEYEAKLANDKIAFSSDKDEHFEVSNLQQAQEIHELKKERYMLRAQVYYKDLGVLEAINAKDKSGYYVGLSYLTNLSGISRLDSNFLGGSVGYINYITPRQALFAEVRGFSNLTLNPNFYSVDLRFAMLQEIGQSFFSSNDVGIYGGISLGNNIQENFTPGAFFGLSILVYKHNRVNLEWSVPFMKTATSFDSLYSTSYSYKF
ncbi:hypothetical protein BKH43_06705 [Helicobacter sp. 13S00401-1]|uniref:hypothetical protein n=1 Tax=Helicobacter sp. 13S00401-1 TaxID=1905758 RepID=UPI000BA55F55|nr:hypothetical protein [Helicobacter sp. 13S00401-1]PAF49336.1 hypothetical protein BKH43_06705 [Helicobacter sp. 13S00401-1]